MKLKKWDYVFAAIVLLLFVACLVHVSVVYSFMKQNSSSGMLFPQPYPYPPEIAFLLIIPYAIAELVTVSIWLIVRRILRKKAANQ